MLAGLLVTYLVLAPGTGFEPATYALTAHRSTVELPRNILMCIILTDLTGEL